MFWTAKISMMKGPSIQNAWPVYKLLFNHLEDEQRKLKWKSATWKQSLLVGITAAKEKLTQYYLLTAGSGGLLYNLGDILEPNQKLSLYDGDTWEDHYKYEYEKEFQAYYKTHYSCLEEKQPHPGQLAKKASKGSLSAAVAEAKFKQHRRDDVTQYLSTLVEPNKDLIAWWKGKQEIGRASCRERV